MPTAFYTERIPLHDLNAQAILVKRRDSKNWYLELRIPGVDWGRPISLKTADRFWAEDKARKKWREVVRKHDQGLPINEPTMEKLFSAFMEWQAERVTRPEQAKDKLRRHKGISQNHIIPMFGKRTLSNLTERDAVKFRDKRLRDGAKLSTVAVDLATLRDWCTFAVDKGYRKERLRAPIGEQKPEDYDNSWFDIATYREMRKFLRDEQNPELFNLVLFCYFTGARVVEARNFKFEDLVRRWNPKRADPVSIRLQGKNKKRTVPVLPIVQTIIDRMAVLHDRRTGHVFPNTKVLSEVFTRFLIKRGLYVDGEGNHRTLGSMRHTRATIELRRGLVLPQELAEWMGHTLREQGRTYSKVLKEMNMEGLYRRRPRRIG